MCGLLVSDGTVWYGMVHFDGMVYIYIYIYIFILSESPNVWLRIIKKSTQRARGR